MTEILVQRSLEEPATEQSIENLHIILDELWVDADFVPPLDQMAFTTAVVEAASNVVQHGVPAAESALLLGVELSVTPGRLRAVISEIGAAPLDHLQDFDTPEDAPVGDPALRENFSESGRGLSMIRALVSTVTVERQGTTNIWVLSRDSDPEN
jgi:serine/threonine-protein kinase RsbW